LRIVDRFVHYRILYWSVKYPRAEQGAHFSGRGIVGTMCPVALEASIAKGSSFGGGSAERSPPTTVTLSGSAGSVLVSEV
jgi:hypothetical protein